MIAIRSTSIYGMRSSNCRARRSIQCRPLAACCVARQEQENLGFVEMAVVEHHLAGVQGQRGTGRVGLDQAHIGFERPVRTVCPRIHFGDPDLQSRCCRRVADRTRFFEPAHGPIDIVAAQLPDAPTERPPAARSSDFSAIGLRFKSSVARRPVRASSFKPAADVNASTSRESSSVAGSRRSSSAALAQPRSSEVDRSGIDHLQTEPAPQPIKGIALIEQNRAGTVAKLLAQANDRRQLGARDRITATRRDRGRQRRTAVEPVARAVDPLVLKVPLDRLAAELVGAIGLEIRWDPKNPNIGVEERKRQWRRFTPDRAAAILEPREEGLLDPFEGLDPGTREAQRLTLDIDARQDRRRQGWRRRTTSKLGKPADRATRTPRSRNALPRLAPGARGVGIR